MKFRVRTGENRCKWVWMGVNGCVRVQGVQETQKQDNWGSSRVSQTRIWVLWPGKFPRTSCFGGFVKKWFGWVQMGTERFRWAQMDVLTRRGAKTRKKEPQMGEQDMFLGVCSTPRNVSCWQKWLWCSERAKGRNKGQIRRALYDPMYLSNGKTVKQMENRKKKAKPEHTNMATGNPRPQM